MINSTYTTNPTSTQSSKFKGIKRPEASFLGSILVAHSKTAMLMNSEFGHVTTDAVPAPKAVREMPLFLDLGHARRDVPARIEIPRWVKTLRILPEDLGVTVHVPYVCDTDSALGDKHSFIPIILGGLMRHARWGDWSPA